MYTFILNLVKICNFVAPAQGEMHNNEGKNSNEVVRYFDNEEVCCCDQHDDRNNKNSLRLLTLARMY